MSIGDFQPFVGSGSQLPGSLEYAVASGTTASIKAGEPVEKLAGAASYAPLEKPFFCACGKDSIPIRRTGKKVLTSHNENRIIYYCRCGRLCRTRLCNLLRYGKE